MKALLAAGMGEIRPKRSWRQCNKMRCFRATSPFRVSLTGGNLRLIVGAM
jgi:hypothetical protein